MPGNIFHFIMQNNNESKEGKKTTQQNKNTQPESKNVFDNSNMENRYDIKIKNENNQPNLLERILYCFESESIIDIIN
jgi:hypothetical protein